MKKIIKIIFTMLILVSVLGCSTYFKRSIDTVENEETKKTIATVIVWENDTNAAILNAEGSVCMQNALAIKTTNTTADIKLSEALLKLSKVATKNLEDNSESNKKALLAVTSSISQTATLLTTTTERTAFLNTGMFYLCQILSNNSIEPQSAQKIMNILITSAAGLGVSKESIETKTDGKNVVNIKKD